MHRVGNNNGKLIVLSAPLTETVDHAGYFIQMALASLPKRLEGIINSKYPTWKELEREEDGSAKWMPAGVRALEAALLREYSPDDIVACYPADLDRFVGPATRVVAHLHPQPARRHFRRRGLHFGLWLL